VVHDCERLPLGLEAGDHLAGVHTADQFFIMPKNDMSLRGR
jgi:hypothetical protein